MAARKREAVTSKDVIQLVLREAGPKLVLVGGQALAFWMDHYGVAMPERLPYVSRDIDLLAPSRSDTAEVRRLARVLGGQTILPNKRALTALVGQAVKHISDEEFINVDVVFRVLGADTAMPARAVKVKIRGGIELRVMHPLDVLKSRLDNLYELAEKQTELGRAQLEAAILVARGLQHEAAAEPPRVTARQRTRVLAFASRIERLARTDAGKKVARRFGVHVADALEPGLVDSPAFHQRKLAQLLPLMSPSRRAEITAGI